MSYEVDFLPFATATGANVDTQGNYSGSGYQQDGWTAGLLPSKQLNKPIRQSSMIAAAVANFISNQLSIALIDDGNLTNLITNLTNAITSAAAASSNRGTAVAFSATPVFDASLGNVFEMILAGNVTSSTIINLVPWQPLTFIIKQDGTGGRTFAAPASLPMTPIASGAGQVSVQTFRTDNALTIYPVSGMTVS
jgi:hypothetical protein